MTVENPDAGNTPETAIPLTPADIMIVHGHVGGSDTKDYFSFTCPGTGKVTICLTDMTDNLYLRLSDENGKIFGGAMPENPMDKRIAYKLEQGTEYYVGVDPYGDAESDYILSVDVTETVPVVEPPEPIEGEVTVEFKKVDKDAVVPEYQTEGSACADLSAVFDDPFGYTYIHPNQTEVISTGLAAAVPVGYELQIRSRSGMSVKGIILANGLGTVDSDYRGTICVVLTNCSPDVIRITQGDRIAQCCLKKVIKINFKEVEELDETGRGERGFGSTGR